VSAERFEVATGRGPVTVFAVGEGPVFGYLHGMAGLDAPTPCMERLAATHRVVAPCLPGFGPTPADPGLRTMHDWVAALSGIADACGITGAPWLASSTSAMLALEVMAVRPEAAAALLAIGPFGLFDVAEPGVDLYAVVAAEQPALLVADPANLGVYLHDPDDIEGDDLVELGISRYLRRRTAASLIWPMADHGLDDRLHRVNVPVTLVWGVDDALVPPSYAGRFAALLSNATVADPIDGAGHLAELDAPEAVAGLAAGLVADLSRTR